MNKKLKNAISLVIYVVIACVLLGVWKYHLAGTSIKRIWHHEHAADADVTLGVYKVPDDYMVDDTFTSHLPLIIIDTHGEEIVNYKYYDAETNSNVYPKGIDPYTEVEISIIDNPNMINHLGDLPTQSSNGRIKVRGNQTSGVRFTKKQYQIKLDTPDGENNPMAIMGMAFSDAWVLNGTQMDESFLRNYIAMNSAGEIEPFTPDMRYCEMVIKRGEKYEYMGLYILYEKIDQGEGRVEIEDLSSPITLRDTAYMLVRDRFSTDGFNISTYATENEDPTNWISLYYPSKRKITMEYWEYIQSDIKNIEDVLYSDDYSEFIQYRKLLDVDSFVDYFLINEFFCNYDSGWHSTYMYKQSDGTLAYGPYWDYDGAMDNYEYDMLELNKFAMHSAPWFDRLIKDEYFVEKLVSRYRYLRENILNEEHLESKIEETIKFIERPVQRDISRWKEHYDGSLQLDIEESTNLIVDRNTDSWEEEVVRLRDVICLRGNYLDDIITDLYNYIEFYNTKLYNTVIGVLFIVTFFVSIILVQKVRKGT